MQIIANKVSNVLDIVFIVVAGNNVLCSSADKSRKRQITIEKNILLTCYEDSILDRSFGMFCGSHIGTHRIHQ